MWKGRSPPSPAKPEPELVLLRTSGAAPFKNPSSPRSSLSLAARAAAEASSPAVPPPAAASAAMSDSAAADSAAAAVTSEDSQQSAEFASSMAHSPRFMRASRTEGKVAYAPAAAAGDAGDAEGGSISWMRALASNSEPLAMSTPTYLLNPPGTCFRSGSSWFAIFRHFPMSPAFPQARSNTRNPPAHDDADCCCCCCCLFVATKLHSCSTPKETAEEMREDLMALFSRRRWYM
mmetsp:Transcript_79220/g.154943  ORF Transcript_79220/g.154943 Transcript_79220/m.154943 type:complete len:234 (+) Transcript_79220:1269-1970(+)